MVRLFGIYGRWTWIILPGSHNHCLLNRCKLLFFFFSLNFVIPKAQNCEKRFYCSWYISVFDSRCYQNIFHSTKFMKWSFLQLYMPSVAMTLLSCLGLGSTNRKISGSAWSSCLEKSLFANTSEKLHTSLILMEFHLLQKDLSIWYILRYSL